MRSELVSAMPKSRRFPGRAPDALIRPERDPPCRTAPRPRRRGHGWAIPNRSRWHSTEAERCSNSFHARPILTITSSSTRRSGTSMRWTSTSTATSAVTRSPRSMPRRFCASGRPRPAKSAVRCETRSQDHSRRHRGAVGGPRQSAHRRVQRVAVGEEVDPSLRMVASELSREFQKAGHGTDPDVAQFEAALRSDSVPSDLP